MPAQSWWLHTSQSQISFKSSKLLENAHNSVDKYILCTMGKNITYFDQLLIGLLAESQWSEILPFSCLISTRSSFLTEAQVPVILKACTQHGTHFTSSTWKTPLKPILRTLCDMFPSESVYSVWKMEGGTWFYQTGFDWSKADNTYQNDSGVGKRRFRT